MRGIYDNKRYTAMGGIRQWEIYGSGRYTAVGDKGKKGHLIRGKKRAD
jgi:hypothetical protein